MTGEKLTIDGVEVGDRVQFPTEDRAFDEAMLGKPMADYLHSARKKQEPDHGDYAVTAAGGPGEPWQMERVASGEGT